MAAQLPASMKRPRADYIIDNDSDMATLEARTAEIWAALVRPRGSLTHPAASGILAPDRLPLEHSCRTFPPTFVTPPTTNT